MVIVMFEYHERYREGSGRVGQDRVEYAAARPSPKSPVATCTTASTRLQLRPESPEPANSEYSENVEVDQHEYQSCGDTKVSQR